MNLPPILQATFRPRKVSKFLSFEILYHLLVIQIYFSSPLVCNPFVCSCSAAIFLFSFFPLSIFTIPRIDGLLEQFCILMIILLHHSKKYDLYMDTNQRDFAAWALESSSFEPSFPAADDRQAFLRIPRT